jgi:predicted nucleic acid-binding protein
MGKIYYFDANALVKFYCDESGSEQIRALVTNGEKIYISELTLLETINVLLSIYRTPPQAQIKRERKYSKKHINKIIRKLSDNIKDSLFILLEELLPNIFSDAQKILLEYGKELNFGSLDALHIAIIESGWKTGEICFVTSDGSGGGRLIGVCKKLQISVYDPEKNIYI